MEPTIIVGGDDALVRRKHRRSAHQDLRDTLDRIERKRVEALQRPVVAEPEITTDVPAILDLPPKPLTEAQRAQVISALTAVPERQLIDYGLEAAVIAAIKLVQELEADDEEAVVMILALTV